MGLRQRRYPTLNLLIGFFLAGTPVLASLAGCSSGMIVPLVVSPQKATVRIGTTLTLSATQQGTPAGGGVWALNGGAANGSIAADGVYTPPSSIPATDVTVTYRTPDQAASSVISVLNPTPVIDQISPATVVQLSTSIAVAGSGFITSSRILVGGTAIPTTFVDDRHLSATIVVTNTMTASLTVAVANPNPGALVSGAVSEAVAIAPVTISPQSGTVRLGNTMMLAGMQLGAPLIGGKWAVNGGAPNGSISPNGVYSPPSAIPPSGVTVTYEALGQTATATISVLNPVPVISQVSPATLNELSNPVIIAGTGFVPGSQILPNGTSVVTTFIDGGHLSATLIVPNITAKSLALAISNPNPGPIESTQADVPVAIAPLLISPASASVRLGTTAAFTASQLGAAVACGTWSVAGGPSNGTIGVGGVYSPPASIPSSTVTVSCDALGQTANSAVTLLNPLATISQVSPSPIVQLNTDVTVTGTGYVPGSQILINGKAIATMVVDSSHLSGTVSVPLIAVTSLAVAVSNPAPGPSTSSPLSLPAAIPPVTIVPQSASVRVGETLTFSGIQGATSAPGGVWSVAGGNAKGTIGPNGLYTPPAVAPPTTVTVTYQAVGQTATSTVLVLNPTPVIDSISPARLTELSGTVTVIGSGFVSGSRILVGGSAIATSVVDSSHLSGTIAVPNISTSSLSLTVSNPNPGAILSKPQVVSVAIAPLIITPQAPSVRVGSTLALTATQLGLPVRCDQWTVSGGSANGSIDTSGLYTPPQTISGSSVTVTCRALGQTAIAVLAVLNPVPVITALTPATILQFITPVKITGSGFVAGSQIMIDGIAVRTTFIDGGHLSATLLVSNNTITSVSIGVANPAPGAVAGTALSLPVAIGPLNVSPKVLAGGNLTITASISGLPSNSVITLGGIPMSTSSVDAASITASGYLPYWRSGSTTVAIAPGVGDAPFAQLDVPIAPTAVSYDVAARFAMQAGFGPRHDIIEHIQQVGLGQFVDEQLQVAPDSYSEPGSPPQLFLLNVVNNNTQLRLRTAWAFQSFIPEQGIFLQPSTLPWEQRLEAHAFGNFRQILLDATSDPNVTTLLNLPGSSFSSNPNVHPNQNFARELMQLFSIGPLMLNDDGTLQTDASGNPIPAYDEDTVENVSRALTGWNYGPTINSAFSFYGIDYSQKLVPVEAAHDHGSKTLFGNVVLAAGQTTTQDRDQVLDAVFQHQNVPAFVSRRLIQKFVKSQPSPAYIARIAAVFKDDGNSVRGNLAAVIKAILLDPEARAGDTAPSDTDGYVQDPLFAELFAMELMDIHSTDGTAAYYAGKLGEPWWFAPSVFAYYSPDYMIPGTTINSPESQLLTTTFIVQRSQFFWGMINGPQTGFESWGSTWLSRTFPTVPALVEALNHIAYHGTMSQFQQDTITTYCSTLPDQTSQLRCTLLLALNGDSYTVVQ